MIEEKKHAEETKNAVSDLPMKTIFFALNECSTFIILDAFGLRYLGVEFLLSLIHMAHGDGFRQSKLVAGNMY